MFTFFFSLRLYKGSIWIYMYFWRFMSLLLFSFFKSLLIQFDLSSTVFLSNLLLYLRVWRTTILIFVVPLSFFTTVWDFPFLVSSGNNYQFSSSFQILRKWISTLVFFISLGNHKNSERKRWRRSWALFFLGC